MAAIQRMVRQLKREANRLQTELDTVHAAIRALQRRGTYRDVSGIGITANRRPRRKMSKSARERIAAAQRARWAKRKARSKKAQ
jgi:hypothetical protein